MRYDVIVKRTVLVALLAFLPAISAQADSIEAMFMDSLPDAQMDPGGSGAPSAAAIMLDGVPTSSWTYGCSATSAGMMFGYYDRNGYVNMYTGLAGGGVAPLTNLGGQCSIIATRDGFDGRTIKGHADDYWVSFGSAGPDPFEGNWAEHAWGDCTADFLGTNQWKWDYSGGGVRDFNTDGSTTLWTISGPQKLHDYIPPASAGLPQTSLCHGLRLFAESRGYDVLSNYTQKVDTLEVGGFSFADFMAEINAGRPVMLQLRGHSVVGVGYDQSDSTVYLHDTWGDYVGSMTWGGDYSNRELRSVTVLELGAIPEPVTMFGAACGLAGVGAYLRRRRRGQTNA